MTRFSLFPAVMCLLISCSGGPSEGYGGGQWGKPSVEGDRRILVEVDTVSHGSVADYLETTGSIESEAQADIAVETTGTVTQIAAEEGDSVSRGQLLAVIENPSLEASARRASIELERAEADLERARTLHGQQAISDSELRQAEVSYRTAQTSANEARRTRGFTRVTSPIDGTVSVRDIRVGELASGRAFQVVDLSRLRVIVQLPEKDLAHVRVDQIVRLSSAYNEGAVSTGKVVRISPVVDPASGTVRVTINVDSGQDALRPGQFAKVRIEVDRHEGVITIPRRGLVWEDGEPVAWVVTDAPHEEAEEETPDEDADMGEDEAGFFARLFGGGGRVQEADEADEADAVPEVDIPQRVAERRVLTVGFMDPEQIEVSEGLSEGEQIVVVGNANLRDGTMVRLPDDPAPQASSEDKDADKGEG